MKEEGLRRREGSRRGKVRVMEMKGKKRKMAKEEAARPIQMCTRLMTPKSLSLQSPELHQTHDSKCILNILT